MKTFLIYCPEIKDDGAVASAHLTERGIDHDLFMGIHGETFGLLPSRPYNADQPGMGHLTPISQVGLTLSHYMLWQTCLHVPGDVFMICESDVKFPTDWKERFDTAMEDLPDDWDIFLIGNSNTSDKEKHHICGDVFQVCWPFCTHCYLVRKKALPVLLRECRDATMKIDLLLIREAYPLLNVYTMLPRLADQRGTELQV